MENPHHIRAAPAGRMLNQQWVFICDSTKLLTASFSPDCPIVFFP